MRCNEFTLRWREGEGAKVNKVLRYPPSEVTNTPTKNTATAVTNLPMLKQNPVAVPRI